MYVISETTFVEGELILAPGDAVKPKASTRRLWVADFCSTANCAGGNLI